MNKVIAGRLGISTRTAEHHRAHIMAKLQTPTPSHLIRLVLGILDSSHPA
jgi:FixJ family two-component response regulator